MNREQRRAEQRAKRGHAKPPRVRTVWKKIDTIKHAIEGAAKMPESMMNELLLRDLAALDMFAKGAARLREWDELVSVNNIAETLASMGVGSEALPDIQRAEQALIDAAARYKRTGKMGLTGPGIQSIREVIEWHDAQRSAIPRSKYQDAIRLTQARIRSGYATIDLEEALGKR